MKILVFDAEIKRMIQSNGAKRIKGLKYCKGWGDFKGMGISVVGAYSYTIGRNHVFMDDNFNALQDAIDHANIVVGYNNKVFDDPLLKANNIHIPNEKSFDILCAMWGAAGLDPVFSRENHRGFSLNETAKANIDGLEKTGDGALALGIFT